MKMIITYKSGNQTKKAEVASFEELKEYCIENVIHDFTVETIPA